MWIGLFVLAVMMYFAGHAVARRGLQLGTDVSGAPRGRRIAYALSGPLGCYLAGLTPMILIASAPSERPSLTIQRVDPGLAAERAGMMAGDQLETVDGVELADFDALRRTIGAAGARQLKVQVKRGTERVTLPLAPEPGPDGAPRIGIYPVRTKVTPSLLEALVAAHVIPLQPWRMVLSASTTPTPVGGPVALYVTPEAPGLPAWLPAVVISFAAYCFLIAVVMLLPMPGLDGGALVLLLAGRNPDSAWHTKMRKGVLVGFVLLFICVIIMLLRRDFAR